MKNLLRLLTVCALTFAATVAHASGKGWLTDFEAAKAQAKAENKPLLVEFHGSDWCPPCKQLNREVLGTEEFRQLVGEAFVLVDLDFPRKAANAKELRAKNGPISDAFNVEGFPTVIILDASGKELGRTVGYDSKEDFLKFVRQHLPEPKGSR